MHFDFLPKATHNEDAVREYERDENRRIKRWLKLLALLVPIASVVIWLLLRLR